MNSNVSTTSSNTMNPNIVFYVLLGLVVLYCLCWAVINVVVHDDKESRIYIVLFIICLISINFFIHHIS